MTIAEELGEAYRADGVRAALARYDELRERYYGRGAYDFGEDALNAFGYTIIEDDLPGATQVFHRNTELFPEVANVWDSLGEAYRNAGDTELATLYYSKALVLDPRIPSARTALQEMREEGN